MIRTFANIRWWTGRATHDEIRSEIVRADHIRAVAVAEAVGRVPLKSHDAERIESKETDCG